jgi:nitrogen regulatory protein PII 2
MKEIIAIIRPRKVGPTRDRLAEIGLPCMTAVAVLGRGKQHGIAGEVNGELKDDAVTSIGQASMRYVPKRLLTIVVSDEQADAVVRAIIEINQTGKIGDGKIVVSDVRDMLRVRTGERGEAAIA